MHAELEFWLLLLALFGLVLLCVKPLGTYMANVHGKESQHSHCGWVAALRDGFIAAAELGLTRIWPGRNTPSPCSSLTSWAPR